MLPCICQYTIVIGTNGLKLSLETALLHGRPVILIGAEIGTLFKVNESVTEMVTYKQRYNILLSNYSKGL